MKRWRPWLVGILAVWGPLTAQAQEAGQVPTARQVMAITWGNLLASVVYGVVGVLLLIGAYYLYELVTPYSVRKELIEDQNIALALVVAAIILGMAIIIAAAIL
jgi:putative membrane protein